MISVNFVPQLPPETLCLLHCALLEVFEVLRHVVVMVIQSLNMPLEAP